MKAYSLKKLSVTGVLFAGLLAGANTVNASRFSSNLCSTLDLATSVSAGAEVGVGAEVEAGAGWVVAFIGKISGKLQGGGRVNLGAGPRVDLTMETCVNSDDLLTMYHRNLLTPEQREQVLLYLGENVVGFSPAILDVDGNEIQAASYNESRKQALNNLLSAGSLTNMQVRRTEASLRPVATVVDFNIRALTGEISALDMVDEQVFAIESLAEAMPLDPNLSAYLLNFKDQVTRQIFQVQEGLEGICGTVANGLPGAANDALNTFCGAMLELADGGEVLEDNLLSILGIVGTVGEQIEKVDVVFDAVVDVTEDIDSTVAGSIKTLDSTVNTLGDTSRQLVDMSSTVNNSIGTLTESIDDITGAANKAISGVMSAVAAPLKVIANLSKGALDGVVSSLQKVNSTLEGLVSTIKS